MTICFIDSEWVDADSTGDFFTLNTNTNIEDDNDYDSNIPSKTTCLYNLYTYCKCKNGSRTIGGCAHAVAVLAHLALLSGNRIWHLPKKSKSLYNMENVMDLSDKSFDFSTTNLNNTDDDNRNFTEEEDEHEDELLSNESENDNSNDS